MPLKKVQGGRGTATTGREPRPTSSASRRPARGGDDGARSAKPATTGSGWGAVIAKKKQGDAGGKNKPVYLEIKNKFFLRDGESAIIQILSAEPVCVDGCALPPDFRDYYVSPKSYGARHCPMVESGLKLMWRAAFKVMDYRGEWDSKANDFKNEPDPDTAVEKYWLVSNTVANQLKAFAEKSRKALTDLVLEVTRTGADKKTSYNFTRAVDGNDQIMTPWDYDEELPPLEVAMKPLPDNVLRELLGMETEDDADINTED